MKFLLRKSFRLQSLGFLGNTIPVVIAGTRLKSCERGLRPPFDFGRTPRFISTAPVPRDILHPIIWRQQAVQIQRSRDLQSQSSK